MTKDFDDQWAMMHPISKKIVEGIAQQSGLSKQETMAGLEWLIAQIRM